MLMATHDLRLAANIANQVVFWSQGTLWRAAPQSHLHQAKKTRTQLFISTLTDTLPDSWEI
jgi:cystine transport system ATP-binding protein